MSPDCWLLCCSNTLCCYKVTALANVMLFCECSGNKSGFSAVGGQVFSGHYMKCIVKMLRFLWGKKSPQNENESHTWIQIRAENHKLVNAKSLSWIKTSKCFLTEIPYLLWLERQWIISEKVWKSFPNYGLDTPETMTACILITTYNNCY